MKAITIPLQQQLAWLLLGMLTVTVNPATANSDKKIMDAVQRAREKSQQHENHSEHVKPEAKTQKYRGVFYGYLPCKDCSGIKTTLSLKNKNNYLLVTQEARASSREFYDKGKYDWDDKSSTLTLTSRKKLGVRKYTIKDEETLIQLNIDGSAISANPEEYTLRRSDSKAVKSREVHIH